MTIFPSISTLTMQKPFSAKILVEEINFIMILNFLAPIVFLVGYWARLARKSIRASHIDDFAKTGQTNIPITQKEANENAPFFEFNLFEYYAFLVTTISVGAFYFIFVPFTQAYVFLSLAICYLLMKVSYLDFHSKSFSLGRFDQLLPQTDQILGDHLQDSHQLPEVCSPNFCGKKHNIAEYLLTFLCQLGLITHTMFVAVNQEMESSTHLITWLLILLILSLVFVAVPATSYKRFAKKTQSPQSQQGVELVSTYDEVSKKDRDVRNLIYYFPDSFLGF